MTRLLQFKHCHASSKHKGFETRLTYCFIEFQINLDTLHNETFCNETQAAMMMDALC